MHENSAVVSQCIQNKLIGDLKERDDTFAERVVDVQRQVAEILSVLRFDPVRFGFVSNADDVSDALLEQVGFLQKKETN